MLDWVKVPYLDVYIGSLMPTGYPPYNVSGKKWVWMPTGEPTYNVSGKNGFCDAVTYSKMGFNSFGMIIIQNIITLLFPKE